MSATVDPDAQRVALALISASFYDDLDRELDSELGVHSTASESSDSTRRELALMLLDLNTRQRIDCISFLAAVAGQLARKVASLSPGLNEPDDFMKILATELTWLGEGAGDD